MKLTNYRSKSAAGRRCGPIARAAEIRSQEPVHPLGQIVNHYKNGNAEQVVVTYDVLKAADLAIRLKAGCNALEAVTRTCASRVSVLDDYLCRAQVLLDQSQRPVSTPLLPSASTCTSRSTAAQSMRLKRPSRARGSFLRGTKLLPPPHAMCSPRATSLPPPPLPSDLSHAPPHTPSPSTTLPPTSSPSPTELTATSPASPPIASVPLEPNTSTAPNHSSAVTLSPPQTATPSPAELPAPLNPSSTSPAPAPPASPLVTTIAPKPETTSASSTTPTVTHAPHNSQSPASNLHPAPPMIPTPAAASVMFAEQYMHHPARTPSSSAVPLNPSKHVAVPATATSHPNSTPPSNKAHVLLHPGVHGGAHVAIERDVSRNEAIVTIRSTVRVTPCNSSGDKECVVSYDDSADTQAADLSDPSSLDSSGGSNEEAMGVALAFAASVAAETSAELNKNVLKQAWRQPLPARLEAAPKQMSHSALFDVLAQGTVTRVVSHTVSKFSHESFVLEIVHEATGRHCQAIFKPRVEGDFDGWHRVPVERVAYVLNRMLSMDFVPPAAMRPHLTVPGHGLYKLGGPVVAFVSAAVELETVPQQQWGASPELLLSDTRILDVLIHNTDRHIGHFLFGRHWLRGEGAPILIDHAAGFRHGACVTMQQDNAFHTGAVRHVSATTYLRLKLLSAAAVADEFQGLLSSAEVRALMRRRDGIVSYLDALVEEHGVENVVLSP